MVVAEEVRNDGAAAVFSVAQTAHPFVTRYSHGFGTNYLELAQDLFWQRKKRVKDTHTSTA